MQMPTIFREWARRIMYWDRIRALGSYRYAYQADRNVYTQREMPDEFLEEIVSMNVADTSFAEDFGKFAAIRVFLLAKMPPGNHDSQINHRNILELLTGPDREIQLSQELVARAIPISQHNDTYEAAMSEYRRYCANPKYRAIVDRVYDAARALRPGSPAPSIRAVDSSGTVHDLSEVRGSITYVVIWTLNCAMCIDQIEACLKIQAQFPNKRISLVCINVHGTNAEWQQVGLGRHTGQHDWFADAAQSASIDRVFGKRSQFRSLLLDADGRIIEVNSLASWLKDLVE
jgi:hypothetical protein